MNKLAKRTTGYDYMPTLFANSLFDLFDSSLDNVFNVKLDYPYDMYEADDGLVTVVEFALAGFKKQDISVRVENDALIVEAKHNETDKQTGNRYFHKGIAKRNLKTKFVLNSMADKKNIKSSFVDGMLKIEVPTNKEEKIIEIM